MLVSDCEKGCVGHAFGCSINGRQISSFLKDVFTFIWNFAIAITFFAMFKDPTVRHRDYIFVRIVARLHGTEIFFLP
jgi:hypothetical protein